MRKSRTPKGETKRRRAFKKASVTAASVRAARLAAERSSVVVNVLNLAPDNSLSLPDFVVRGFYFDQAFTCKDCGANEIWTATQQKWWYESAKGGVWTTAIRCRPCRRRERERKKLARTIHANGIARKKQSLAAVPSKPRRGEV